MLLTLQRLAPFGAALPGDLLIDGHHEAVSLENADKAIPDGRYSIAMTVSGRATAGGLWSPRADNVLPLVCDVPGREGIRIHAANRADQLEGCIATGSTRDGMEVSGSRTALIRVMNRIEAAQRLGEEVWIDVVDVA